MFGPMYTKYKYVLKYLLNSRATLPLREALRVYITVLRLAPNIFCNSIARLFVHGVVLFILSVRCATDWRRVQFMLEHVKLKRVVGESIIRRASNEFVFISLEIFFTTTLLLKIKG